MIIDTAFNIGQKVYYVGKNSTNIYEVTVARVEVSDLGIRYVLRWSSGALVCNGQTEAEDDVHATIEAAATAAMMSAEKEIGESIKKLVDDDE